MKNLRIQIEARLRAIFGCIAVPAIVCVPTSLTTGATKMFSSDHAIWTNYGTATPKHQIQRKRPV